MGLCSVDEQPNYSSKKELVIFRKVIIKIEQRNWGNLLDCNFFYYYYYYFFVLVMLKGRNPYDYKPGHLHPRASVYIQTNVYSSPESWMAAHCWAISHMHAWAHISHTVHTVSQECELEGCAGISEPFCAQQKLFYPQFWEHILNLFIWSSKRARNGKI